MTFVLITEVEIEMGWFDGLFGPNAAQRRAHDLMTHDAEGDPGADTGILVLTGENPDNNGLTPEDDFEDPMGFSD